MSHTSASEILQTYRYPMVDGILVPQHAIDDIETLERHIEELRSCLVYHYNQVEKLGYGKPCVIDRRHVHEFENNNTLPEFKSTTGGYVVVN